MTKDSPVSLVRTDHATADADEVPRLVRSWLDNEYYQLDAGRFEGRLREAALGNTRIIEETQNRTVLKRGTIAEDRCHFCFARSFGGAGRYDDQYLTSTSFSFVPSGEFDIQIPPSSIVLISVNREEFMNVASQEGHWIESDERRPLTWEMPGRHPLAEAVDILLEQNPAAPGAAGMVDAGYLSAVLFDRILATLDHPLRQEARVTMGRQKAYHTVRAAREFIDSVRDEPLTVFDLCRALNVSRRTLQYSFTEIHGIAPLSYLRRVRLNRARRDLAQPRDNQTSVASVAMDWGFWHLSRFARDYHHLFGEFPSDTLRRAHGQVLPGTPSFWAPCRSCDKPPRPAAPDRRRPLVNSGS